jgi:tetratricopeptide (TPR) repeat protein
MELGFVRRHRVGLAGTLAVVVAVVVLTGAGLVRARIARWRADDGEAAAAARKNSANLTADAGKREQAEVEQEARRAKAVKDFVTQMLAEADPVRTKGGVDKRRVIELLDKAAAECAVKFREDREAEIGVHWALASAYNGLGQLPQAVEQSRIAHELAEHALGRESKAYVRVARTEIEWLLQARRYIEMEQLAVATLETSRRVYGPAHAVTRSVWRYGVVARARQSSPEVAAMLLRDLEKDAGVDGSADGRRQPLTIVTELPSSAPPDGHRAQTLTTQPKQPAVAVMPAPVAVVPAPAAVLHAPAPVAHAAAPASAPAPVPSRDGWREALWAACRTVTTGEKPDEAEDAVRAALASAAAETTRTSDAAGDALVCERAGWYFSSERRHATAALLYRRAYVLRMGALGAEHGQTLATAFGLSRELIAAGTAEGLAEAVEIRRRLLAAQVKAGGAESPALIVAQVNLAEALRAAGMMEEYKRTLTGLLAIARDHEAQGDGRAPAVTFQIALALRALDERGVELAAWRTAQEVSTSAWGPQYGIDRHVQLGNCLARKGNVAEAEQVLRHARDLHAQYSGRASMAYAQTTRDLAEVVLESGRVEEAVKLYREVVEVAGGAGESADDLGQALLALAGALGMEHAAEAEATYSRAVQHWAAAKSAAGTGRAERALGLFYLEQERYELAEEQLLAARRNFEQLRGTGAAGRLDVTADLVELYNACGKPAEAARWEGRLPGAAAVTVVEASGR